DERASDILEILPPDEAADVLGDISEERAERILHLMEPEEAEDVRELLRYGDETAGGRMTTEYIALSDGMTAAQALAQLRKEAPDAETIYYVYVTGYQGKLEGVLSLRDLITANDDTPIADLARRNFISADVTDDQETVARTLNHYHLLAVPVTNEHGVLLGIVTVDDVLDVFHEEAEEDISRLAGAVEESDTLATPWEQASLRLPWTLGAALAGMGVAFFLLSFSAISRHLLLPLLALLPLLVLLGSHIGGQGAAMTQVALGEGEEISDIMKFLLSQQWPIGLGLSASGAIAAGLLSSMLISPNHAFAVAGVVLFVLLIDMLAGGLLPLLFHRLRWDPIFVSRPALAVMALLLGVPLLSSVL
ncbi:MAG TPA: CBS domain-containing protein, partial [Armatimonadota bacterium]|nr:CBS domain-containing protein [Armatimonadota bacterium]